MLDISSADRPARSPIHALQKDQTLYLGEEEGSAFAGTDIDFAHFQAIVWEMRLPVRADVLQETSPAIAQMMRQVEILDFPGISQEGIGG